jgi:hypothetical protein
MSPSSPSNAEVPPGGDFKVSTRALAADLSSAHAEESSRELGSVDAARLLALLEKLSALDAAVVAEADPQIVVSARRGRFTIRPSQGRLLIRPAADGGQNYWEFNAADVPAFLEGRDAPGGVPADPTDPVDVAPPPKTRLPLALSLFAIAASAMALSAWLTFRPVEWDAASLYAPITTPAEVATLRQTQAGLYVSGGGDDERSLEVDARGGVRYREYGPGRAVSTDRGGASTLARRRADGILVLRVSHLGSVEIKDADTLMFARDSYRRQGTVNP